MTSNRLAHLQGVAEAEYQRFELAEAEAIGAYLACGAALVEAKDTSAHGVWLAWLRAAGVPVRTAQRMMDALASRFEMRHRDVFGRYRSGAPARRHCQPPVAWGAALADRWPLQRDSCRSPVAARKGHKHAKPPDRKSLSDDGDPSHLRLACC